MCDEDKHAVIFTRDSAEMYVVKWTALRVPPGEKDFSHKFYWARIDGKTLQIQIAARFGSLAEANQYVSSKKRIPKRNKRYLQSATDDTALENSDDEDKLPPKKRPMKNVQAVSKKNAKLGAYGDILGALPMDSEGDLLDDPPTEDNNCYIDDMSSLNGKPRSKENRLSIPAAQTSQKKGFDAISREGQDSESQRTLPPLPRISTLSGEKYPRSHSKSSRPAISKDQGLQTGDRESSTTSGTAAQTKNKSSSNVFLENISNRINNNLSPRRSTSVRKPTYGPQDICRPTKDCKRCDRLEKEIERLRREVKDRDRLLERMEDRYEKKVAGDFAAVVLKKQEESHTLIKTIADLLVPGSRKPGERNSAGLSHIGNGVFRPREEVDKITFRVSRLQALKLVRRLFNSLFSPEELGISVLPGTTVLEEGQVILSPKRALAAQEFFYHWVDGLKLSYTESRQLKEEFRKHSRATLKSSRATFKKRKLDFSSAESSSSSSSSRNFSGSRDHTSSPGPGDQDDILNVYSQMEENNDHSDLEEEDEECSQLEPDFIVQQCERRLQYLHRSDSDSDSSDIDVEAFTNDLPAARVESQPTSRPAICDPYVFEEEMTPPQPRAQSSPSLLSRFNSPAYVRKYGNQQTKEFRAQKQAVTTPTK